MGTGTALVRIALVSVAAAGVVLPQKEAAELAAEALVDRLTETNVDATAAALAEMPAKTSLPPVVATILTDRRPWSAIRVLQRVCAGSSRTDSGHEAAAAALGRALAGAENRVAAALAIGAMGERGSGAAEELIALLERGTEVELQLAAATALGNLGEGAARKLGKALAKKRYLGAALLLGAARALGDRGRRLRSAMQKIVAKDKTVGAYLMCRAARDVLKGLSEKQAAAAWDKRVNMHSKKNLAPPFGEGLNLNAYVAGHPATALLMLRGALGQQEPPSAVGVSLPARFESELGRSFCLGDALQCYATHVAGEVAGLSHSFYGGGFAARSDWDAATGPLVKLLRLLDRL